jgi:UDP-N-acetylenolpyruvoylglucosamine reductase
MCTETFCSTKGHATARYCALIRHIKARAREVYGIELEEEVQFLGL